jgi:hypothetical protein
MGLGLLVQFISKLGCGCFVKHGKEGFKNLEIFLIGNILPTKLLPKRQDI